MSFVGTIVDIYGIYIHIYIYIYVYIHNIHMNLYVKEYKFIMKLVLLC